MVDMDVSRLVGSGIAAGVYVVVYDCQSDETITWGHAANCGSTRATIREAFRRARVRLAERLSVNYAEVPSPGEKHG